MLRYQDVFPLTKANQPVVWHCNEYLSRAAFWKHRRAYYDVDKERWMTKDGAEHLEHETKKPKYHPDHEFSEVMCHLILLVMRILHSM